MVALTEHFSSGGDGLTNFDALRANIELLVERLYQAVLAQKNWTLLDKLFTATKSFMPCQNACTNII